jgi:hypothetical protein
LRDGSHGVGRQGIAGSGRPTRDSFKTGLTCRGRYTQKQKVLTDELVGRECGGFRRDVFRGYALVPSAAKRDSERENERIAMLHLILPCSSTI